jgi:hypothetical protein
LVSGVFTRDKLRARRLPDKDAEVHACDIRRRVNVDRLDEGRASVRSIYPSPRNLFDRPYGGDDDICGDCVSGKAVDVQRMA